MDRSVPAGAASLLAFIARTETSRDFPEAYEVIYGHNQAKLPKRLTTMTLGEVQTAQGGWSSRFGSSATGAYQFMKATLRDLITELRLNRSQVLDGNLQDRLGYHLLKRRGYEQWAAGTITDTEFAKRLAMEWASFPVLADTKGAHNNLKAGQSYYAGDGLNKALVPIQTVRNELAKARAALKGGVSPVAAPKPVPVPTMPLPEPAKGNSPPIGLIIIALVVVAIVAAIFFTRF